MRRLGKILLRILIVFLAMVLVVGWIVWAAGEWIKFTRPIILGATFSSEFARYLKLDSRQAYLALFDEWNFKNVRLSAQWDIVEKEKGKWDFSELDWQMKEADKHGAKIILALGQKTPRWPECHIPDWAKNLSEADYNTALDNYLQKVVEHYRGASALEIWQVENEPFFPFGKDCRAISSAQFAHELAVVKKSDSTHPTLTTDSGELSFWTTSAHAADLFGTTMYRIVWNKSVGYLNYNWVPALFYRGKLALVGRSANTAYVMELQAEPWIPGGDIFATSLAEQYKSMSPAQLQKNIQFASDVGLPRAYLWGAEWWYWLKTQGANAIPDYIKSLVKNP